MGRARVSPCVSRLCTLASISPARGWVGEGGGPAEPAKTAQHAVATDPQSAARAHFERWGFRPLPGPVSLGGHRFDPSLFEAVANAIKRLDHVEALIDRLEFLG